MKSPLEKLRKFALNKNDPKENWDHHISVHADGLTQAAKDMKDMRTCYDSLLSAAAATANSAYEFSESFMEMGDCLLEKTAIRNGGETGEALSLMGGVQIELQKLVDIYRSHIIKTITNPSESLLNELRKVEEMKLQCDEKREMFECMVRQLREKGKSRHGKGETFTSLQLQAVCEEYDDVARLCIFRVESLKQGQCRSLLTQAARHHAAQIDFFRKGLQSLEAVEPHIRNIAEKQHIDYVLSDLNGGEGDDEANSSETNDVGELSFNYRRNNQEPDQAFISRKSIDLDHPIITQPSRIKDFEVQMNTGTNKGEQIQNQQQNRVSHSAPIYAEKFDPAERIREMRTAVQKLNTHVLPIPADAKGSVSNTKLPLGSSKNLWHSTPMDIQKQKKTIDEDNSIEKHSHPLPRPLTEAYALPQFDTHGGFDTGKVKRQAFSGPLASKPLSNKPILHASGPISFTEVPLYRVSVSQPPSSINVSRNSSPPLVSSPKISELHELPRPPDSLNSQPMRFMGAHGHSAPLTNKNQEIPPRRNPFKGRSPVPLPQLTVSRSFSIPSSSQRTTAYNSGKLLESSQVMQDTGEVVSPTLMPISLSSPNSGHIRVDAGGR